MCDADQHPLVPLTGFQHQVMWILGDDVSVGFSLEIVGEPLPGLKGSIHSREGVEGVQSLGRIIEKTNRERSISLGFAQRLAPARLHVRGDGIETAPCVDFQGVATGGHHGFEAQ